MNTTIDKNYQHLSKIFLDLLLKNKDFKPIFQVFAPDIYADIESASTNPNCSCRAKIEQYVLTNRETSTEFLNKFLTDFNVEVDLKAIEAQYGFELYSGRVERVKISDWGQFTKDIQAKRAAFRSFSLLRVDDENVDVFFI